VVRATSGQWAAVQPLDVIGAPVRTAPPAAAIPVVDAVSVAGSGPPGAWFGGPAERDVTVTVSNPSSGVVRDARVEVRWGDRGSEQSRMLDVPDAITAGSDAVVTTTVELDAMTWGDVPVRARVVTTGEPTWVETTASTHPWGLLVAAFVLVQIAVIAILRRNRRRRRQREAELADETFVPPERDERTETVPLVPEVAVSGSVRSDLEGGGSGGPAPLGATSDLQPAPRAVAAGGGGAALAAFPLAAGAVGVIDRSVDRVTPEPSAVVDHNLTGRFTAAPWTGARFRIR